MPETSHDHSDKSLQLGHKTADTQIWITFEGISVGAVLFKEREQIDKFIHELTVVRELLPPPKVTMVAAGVNIDDLEMKGGAIHPMKDTP